MSNRKHSESTLQLGKARAWLAMLAACLSIPAQAQIIPPAWNGAGALTPVNFQPGCLLGVRNYTPERNGMLPTDRLQVVAHYDGSGTAARLDIKLRNPVTNQCCTLSVRLPGQWAVQATEYEMNGFEPTGEFTVSGAIPNGSVDGVAFGLYMHTLAGERWIIKSKSPGLAVTTPNFVGSWPTAWDQATWDAMLPAGLGFPYAPNSYEAYVARRQAQSTLSGAQLLPNGTHTVPTRMNAIPGDLNGDGCVDQDDEMLMLHNIGTPPSTYIGLCPIPTVAFTPDRFGALPPDRLQVVATLDGNGQSDVIIELHNPATLQTCDLMITTPPAGQILAQEYQLNGFEPTGVVQVLGLNPNGGLDGVALGMYFRDVTGDRCLMRTDDAAIGAQFAGGWPVAWDQLTWNAMLPVAWSGAGFNGFVAQRQAQSTLAGARFLPATGVYRLSTCAPVQIDAYDMNGDGIVDFFDLALLQSQMGLGCCP